jgi:hypothetical protein
MPLRRHIYCILLAIALPLACGDNPAPEVGNEDGVTGESGTDAGVPPTNPDAPDALCAVDPARVYLLETPTSLVTYQSLTDVEDPSIHCAYAYVANGRLDPVDGSLVALTGTSRVYLTKHVPDPLIPNARIDEPWRPDTAEDNDITIAEVFYGDGVSCMDQAVRELVSDTTTLYASCGGVTLNAPELEVVGGSVYPLVGIVDGRRIWGPFGYETHAAGDDEVYSVPLPAGVDAIQHLAARPDESGLLAAIYVFRGDEVTLERASVTPEGVTLVGAYTHDVEDAGIEGISTHALAADGTLYSLGGVFDNGSGPGLDTVVIRLPVEGPPEVIYEATLSELEVPPRLVAVGAG